MARPPLVQQRVIIWKKSSSAWSSNLIGPMSTPIWKRCKKKCKKKAVKTWWRNICSKWWITGTITVPFYYASAPPQKNKTTTNRNLYPLLFLYESFCPVKWNWKVSELLQISVNSIESLNRRRLLPPFLKCKQVNSSSTCPELKPAHASPSSASVT